MNVFKTSIKLSHIIILLLCISCNREEKKLMHEITQLEKDSAKLEKEITYYNSKIEEVNTKNYNLYFYNYRNYVNKKDVINALPNKLKYLANKKEVFKMIFNNLELDKHFAYDRLSHFLMYENSIPEVFDDKIAFIQYHLFLFNRSSDNIKKLFTDETIDIIASFFKGNSYYKDSGAKYYIEGLLITHRSLTFKENTKETLSRYYNLLANENEGWLGDKTLTMDEKLFDRDVIKYFKTPNFSGYDEGYNVEYDKDSEGNLKDEAVKEFTKCSYSFWARRYHEGNQEIVYEILSKIHHKITGSDVLLGEE